MTDADVARIVAGPESGGGDPIETALLRATDELYRDDGVSDGTWVALARGSRHEAIARRSDCRRRLSRDVDGDQQRGVFHLDANMADFRFPGVAAVGPFLFPISMLPAFSPR